MIPSLGIWFKTKKSKKTALKKVWTNIEYILSTEESFQHCIGMVNAWICPTFMKFQEIKTNKPIDVLSGQKNGFCSYQSLKKRRSGYCVILLLSLKINTKMTKISKKLISKKLIDGHGWIGFIEERQSGLHWPERKKTSVKPWPWKKVTNSRSREIRTTRAMASKKWKLVDNVKSHKSVNFGSRKMVDHSN